MSLPALGALGLHNAVKSRSERIKPHKFLFEDPYKASMKP